MAVLWNESVNGDFANNAGTPTALGALSLGDNVVTGALPGAPTEDDFDHFSFVVPAETVLTGITVTQVDIAGFPNGANIFVRDDASGDAIGISNLRDLSVGVDLFDVFGFQDPLPAGTYRVIIPALGVSFGANAYGFNFVAGSTNNPHPPVATDDSASTNENTAVALDVLDNDSDEDDDALTVAEINGQAATVGSPIALASGAEVTLNADGTIGFDPNGAYEALGQGDSASASFSYTISDDATAPATDTATATVTITGVNDAPSAIDLDNSTVDENDAGAVIGALSVADADAGDSHTFSVSDARFEVVGGELKLRSGISLDFEAAPSVSLEVTATDRAGSSRTERFTIEVGDVAENPPPDAVDDAFDVAEDAPLLIAAAALLANDSDPGGEPLTLTAVGGASNGTVALDGGIVTFTPDAGFDGAASFTYEVTDSAGGTDTATVAVTVTPTILGTEFPDRINGTSLADRIRAFTGDDTVDGRGGNDLLHGGTGDDRLLGGEGDDEIFGGVGNDRLDGGTGRDLLRGEDGHDDLSGGEGDDEILGGLGNDQLFGGGGRDVLHGEDGNDQLAGGDAADELFGGAGNDTLHGGPGPDLLAGGLGADTFDLGLAAQSPRGGGARDAILDFSRAQGDRIDLADIDAIPGAGNQAFSFRGTAAFGANASGQLRALDLGTTVVVQGSTDADRDAEVEIEVRNFAGVLAAADFML